MTVRRLRRAVSTLVAGALVATAGVSIIEAAPASASIGSFSYQSPWITSVIPTPMPASVDPLVNDLSDFAPGTFKSLLAALPIRHIPIRHIPIRHIPIRHIPIRHIANTIPLARVPLLRDGGWELYLAGTPLAGTPIQQLTLEDVLALAPGASAQPDITLDDIDVSQSVIANLSIASVALGELPLAAIALTPDWSSLSDAQRLAAWCSRINSTGTSCTGVTTASTLAALDISGVPIRHINVGALTLSQLDLSESPIRHIPIRHIALSEAQIASSPIRHIPIRHITTPAALFNCTLIDCSAAVDNYETVGNAFAANAVLPVAEIGDLLDRLPGSTSVGQVLALLIDATNIAWDEVSFSSYPLDYSTGSRHKDSIDVTFVYQQGPAVVAGATVEFAFPLEFRAQPGVQLRSPQHPTDPFGDWQTQLPWVVDTVGDENTLSGVVPFEVSPGDQLKFSVGLVFGSQLDVDNVDFEAAISIPGAGTQRFRAPLDAYVDTNQELLPGSAAAPRPVALNTVAINFVRNVSTPRLYQPALQAENFWSVPAPPAGKRLRVSMTGIGTDLDMIAYRPVEAPLGGGTASTGITQVPVEAETGGVTAASTTAQAPVLDGLEPVGASLDRGVANEDLNLASTDTPTNYVIRVTSPVPTTGDNVYRLYAQYLDVSDPGVCDAVTGLSVAPGAVPTIPMGTDALVLRANGRMQAAFAGSDGAGLSALNNALSALVAQGPTLSGGPVHPFVIDVGDLPGVAAAYDARDAHPCDPTKANGVVDSIRSGMLGLLTPGLKADLRTITLVGADDMIPQARLLDASRTANESAYVADVETDAGGNNPIAAAHRSSRYLSDDPFGDFAPTPWLDRYVYVPELAVGRLVERPSDAAAAVQQFIANGGQLDPQTAHVAGYDFLSDGSQAVNSALPNTLTKTQQIDTSWTGSDLAAQTNGKDIVSLGAHFDHYNLLPNASNRPPALTPGPVHNDQQLNLAANSIVFSMGCHSGLSIPSSYGVSGDRALDWAERARLQNAAVFVGNTGYGYGNTKSVALTERLMELFARRLDGSVSAGQALALAKQEYFSNLGAYGGHDEKALQESTFYGLPMWRITGPGTVPAIPTPPTLAAAVPGGASTVINTASVLTTVSTSLGEYDQVVGTAPQVTEDQPIVPRESFDVTQPNLTAHGVLIEDLTTTDRAGNAVVAGPAATDGTLVNAEPSVTGTAFPSVLATVNSTTDLLDADATAGVDVQRSDRQRAVLLRGQFFADSNPATGTDQGVIRKITNLAARVYYADPNSTDFAGPQIASVESVPFIPSGTDFEVTLADSAQRVVVLARTSSTSWAKIELADEGGGVWGGHSTARALEFFVQAVDNAGNVTTDSNRGIMYSAGAAPVVGAVATINATQGTSVAVSVPFTDADSRAWTGSIDWSEGLGPEAAIATNASVNGSHTYNSAGTYPVAVMACDESGACAQTSVTIRVSAMLPTVSISAAAALEGNGPAKTALRYTVSLSRPNPTQTVTVQYATSANATGASATPGTDFKAIALRTLTFLPGQVAKKVTVSVIPDAAVEADEIVAVQLSGATNANLRTGNALGIGTIIDDDGANRPAAGSTYLVEGDSKTRTISIPVSISSASALQFPVTVSTLAGTAAGGVKPTSTGADYVNKTANYTFGGTVTTKVFSVTILPDTTVEPDESFSIVVSHGGTGSMQDVTITVVIQNDD